MLEVVVCNVSNRSTVTDRWVAGPSRGSIHYKFGAGNVAFRLCVEFGKTASTVSKMSATSRASHGGSFLGLSSQPCFCGVDAAAWRAGTPYNNGRVFLKCASERVFVHWCKDIHLQNRNVLIDNLV
jgi:hypothetical protein